MKSIDAKVVNKRVVADTAMNRSIVSPTREEVARVIMHYENRCVSKIIYFLYDERSANVTQSTIHMSSRTQKKKSPSQHNTVVSQEK